MIKRRGQLASAAMLLMLLAANPVQAQTSSEHETSEGFHAPHHLSLLPANTHVRGEGDFASLGVDYEYRVNQLLGLGVVVEHAFDGLDATTVLAVADVHLHGGLIMQLGPGVEFVEDHEIFVSRVGVLYEFEFGRFTLSPQLHWDYHEHHENAVVAGLAFGFAF